MRYVVFFILIALLPLRSWAGDTMAIQMAAQATASANTSPDHADCAEHAAMEADDTGHGNAADSKGHCNTCPACQACSAVALAFPDSATTLTPLPYSIPRWTAARFTSADRALGQKPPIF